MKKVEPPIAGEALRASWGRSVADNIRELTPRGAPGVLVGGGPGGATIRPIKQVLPRTPAYAPPKQWSVTCGTNGTTYVRFGWIRHANRTLTLHQPSVAGGGATVAMFFTNYRVTFNPALADGDTRWLYMECLLRTGIADLKVAATDAEVVDDPVAMIVRWPLVKLLCKVIAIESRPPAASYDAVCYSVAEIAHEGIIKIPAVMGPPV